jgi:hypothetical protein
VDAVCYLKKKIIRHGQSILMLDPANRSAFGSIRVWGGCGCGRVCLGVVGVGFLGGWRVGFASARRFVGEGLGVVRVCSGGSRRRVGRGYRC